MSRLRQFASCSTTGLPSDQLQGSRSARASVSQVGPRLARFRAIRDRWPTSPIPCALARCAKVLLRLLPDRPAKPLTADSIPAAAGAAGGR